MWYSLFAAGFWALTGHQTCWQQKMHGAHALSGDGVRVTCGIHFVQLLLSLRVVCTACIRVRMAVKVGEAALGCGTGCWV